MRTFKYIVILLILSYPTIAFSCCFGEWFSITELLNHDPENHHIFTCKILETHIRNGSYESIAVIQKRYVGSPKDTIYIDTGGNTTAGGEKLFPNAEWLIVSTTNDYLHYNATVCDNLSAQLKKGTKNECERDISPLGKIYLEVLAQYEIIKKKKFSGSKKIVGLGKLIATGSFLNGTPHGDWVHYSQHGTFEDSIIKSEISYQTGRLNGKYNVYDQKENSNIITEKRIYQLDLPVLIESYGGYVNKYEYISDTERRHISTVLDSSGVQLRQINFIQLDFNSKKYDMLSFQNGYYFSKLGRDSSYFPLAEGYYYRGVRVGKWKFFNKKGALISTTTYPDSIDKVPQFQVYDEGGKLKLSGIYIKGKRIGVWKYLYDNKLEYEELYNANGEKISKTHFFSSGGLEFTPYLNNQKSGQKIVLNEDNTIRSIENYANGVLNGMSIFFNQDGTINNELKFVNTRAFSVVKNENHCFYANGLLNGHYVSYNYNTGDKTIEGELWNEYRTGTWIEYRSDGSYTKKYYPTDTYELINECYNSPKLTENYNKDDKLTSSW
jgi:antitoxin component YwqK of YwqJK toxin-antitoxin module